MFFRGIQLNAGVFLANNNHVIFSYKFQLEILAKKVENKYKL
jgi:hypothetical protein